MTEPGPLVVVMGNRSIPIAAPPALVGRQGDVAVVVEHPLVSRYHGRLVVDQGVWYYEDLGSSNGSYVEGVRVERIRLDRERHVLLGAPIDGAILRLAPSAAGTVAAAAREPFGVPAGTTIRIGRDPANDLVLDDLLVSRFHAEVVASATGLQIVDRGSHNGTLVNGVRVRASPLAPGDLVAVGRHRFRVDPAGHLEPDPDADSALAANAVTYSTRSGVTLVSEVSMYVPPSSLVALLGPSGSGKSSLVALLSGQRAPSAGSVRYGPIDMATAAAALRHRVGSVPQDDLVHRELTVAESLRYAARLRFPPDVPDGEIERRVETVMAELALVHRRDVRVRDLSGGQRKRVSVALELLTQPSLLFLDEPTSGLDPGLERTMTEQLRRLAAGGRIVVVVTHSVESLYLCDLVVCLVPGGRLAYVGPPEGVCPHFGAADFQEVYRQLERTDVDWPSRFSALTTAPRSPESTSATTAAQVPPRGTGWTRQYRTLVARNARVLRNDPRTLALLAVGAPVLGLMLLLRLPHRALALPPTGELRLFSQASIVLFLIMLGLTQLAVSMSVREIVKELPIYRRERAVGLSVSAYVAAKATVLGAVVVAQAAVVVLVATARQDGPGEALVLGNGRVELVAAAALAGLAALALALFCSALATSVDRVALLLPAILGFQALAASGPIFPGGNEVPVLEHSSYVSSTYWGFSAAAATSELNELQAIGALGRVIAQADTADLLAGRVELPARTGDPRFNHTTAAWGSAMVVLAVMTLVFLSAAGVALRRHDLR